MKMELGCLAVLFPAVLTGWLELQRGEKWCCVLQKRVHACLHISKLIAEGPLLRADIRVGFLKLWRKKWWWKISKWARLLRCFSLMAKLMVKLWHKHWRNSTDSWYTDNIIGPPGPQKGCVTFSVFDVGCFSEPICTSIVTVSILCHNWDDQGCHPSRLRLSVCVSIQAAVVTAVAVSDVS